MGVMVALQLDRTAAALELLKPITWFPPMWAFLCGAVSADGRFGWPLLAGILLAGPIVTGMSQAANDWCDRHVDAINEPGRPIPSGRLPGRTGLWIALAMTGVAALWAAALGPVVLAGALVGIACAWAYSAEPVRLKRSWLWGPGVVGLCYEGLPWITGAAIASGGWPRADIWLLAGLYAIGAHGIMTLNDFKAVEGDRVTGVRSMPVVFGIARAIRIALAVMILPQLGVVALLAAKGSLGAAVVAVLVAGQVALAPRIVADPAAQAPKLGALATLLSVLGMMVAAVSL